MNRFQTSMFDFEKEMRKMTKPETMTNDKARSKVVHHSGVRIPSSFACHAVARRVDRARACRAVAWRRRVLRAWAFIALSLPAFPLIGQAADNLGILGAHPRW